VRCEKETNKRGGRTKLHKTNHLVDGQKPTVHAPKGEPSSLISAKNDLLYCAFSLATHLCQLQVSWHWLLSYDMKHIPHNTNFSCLLKAVVLTANIYENGGRVPEKSVKICVEFITVIQTKLLNANSYVCTQNNNRPVHFH
jgi:hypothetical protein